MTGLLARPRPPVRPIATGLLYYRGVRCPSCGGRHFHLRATTAECARCDGALIIADARQHHEGD